MGGVADKSFGLPIDETSPTLLTEVEVHDWHRSVLRNINTAKQKVVCERCYKFRVDELVASSNIAVSTGAPAPTLHSQVFFLFEVKK